MGPEWRHSTGVVAIFKDLVMRKILATVMVAFATLFAAPVMAADIPEYPDIEIPEVDYDLGDSFYLRGSAALNVHWAREVNHPDVCGSCTTPSRRTRWATATAGASASVTRPAPASASTRRSTCSKRSGLGITKTGFGARLNGKYSLMLRSTIALANVYYDFSLGDFGGYGGSGGAFGYVGAGAGVCVEPCRDQRAVGDPVPTGGNVSAAACGHGRCRLRHGHLGGRCRLPRPLHRRRSTTPRRPIRAYYYNVT
jgi:hypothetical protein